MQSMRAAQAQQAALATSRLTPRPAVPLHRQRVACRSAAHTAVTEQQTAAPPRLQRHERLNNPAKIGSTGTATVHVKDMGHSPTATGEDISLDAYMRCVLSLTQVSASVRWQCACCMHAPPSPAIVRLPCFIAVLSRCVSKRHVCLG
jgi:hypothetical protein